MPERTATSPLVALRLKPTAPSASPPLLLLNGGGVVGEVYFNMTVYRHPAAARRNRLHPRQRRAYRRTGLIAASTARAGTARIEEESDAVLAHCKPTTTSQADSPAAQQHAERVTRLRPLIRWSPLIEVRLAGPSGPRHEGGLSPNVSDRPLLL